MDTLIYNENNFSFNKTTKTFIAEASELNIGVPSNEILLKIDNTAITFNLSKIDKDGTNEDTYGWRYKSDDNNNFNLLIIND